MDYPRQTIVPTHLNTFMSLSIGVSLKLLNAGPAGAVKTWVANQAVYVPFTLPWPFVMRRMFWNNGSAAGGNHDVGIYTVGGSKIVSSGSTAGSGNSAVQYVTPTETLLSPGSYFWGYAHDSATASHCYGGTLTAITGRETGVYSQTTAFALPATATFATNASLIVPLVGMTSTSSGY